MQKTKVAILWSELSAIFLKSSEKCLFVIKENEVATKLDRVSVSPINHAMPMQFFLGQR